MKARILIWFPVGDAPGLRTEAAQLALRLAAHGYEVAAFGQLGAWRHTLRLARIAASESELPDEDGKLLEAIHAFTRASSMRSARTPRMPCCRWRFCSAPVG